MAEELKGILKERYQKEYEQFMVEEARKVMGKKYLICFFKSCLYHHHHHHHFIWLVNAIFILTIQLHKIEDYVKILVENY